MNPYKVVAEFEEAIADWAGAPRAVAVESCSAALFLCCVYQEVKQVTIPKRTYPSVPNAIIHAGGTVRFDQVAWSGEYVLFPYPIWDSALRLRKNMYQGGFQCLSFHVKKHLSLGRGGMILTNDKQAVTYLKRARFDGRGEMPLSEDNLTQLGWNMYMEPAQAIRGLQLFEVLRQQYPDGNVPDLDVASQGYPDLSQYAIYSQGATK